MLSQEHLRKLIQVEMTRLQILEEQKAKFGPLYTPPYILMDINAATTELRRLQARLEAERHRLRPLLDRVPKKRWLSSERAPGEFDLDIVKNGALQFVFLAGLTGEALPEKTIKKVAREVMAYHRADLGLRTTTWIEYQSRTNRFCLLRLFWRLESRRVMHVERRPLAFEHVERWLGLPELVQTGQFMTGHPSVYTSAPLA